MKTPSLAPMCVIALSLPLVAQTYTWSPPNAANGPGGAGNTIPFWGKSATYQQVHEAPTMGASAVLSIRGMGMRPTPRASVKGRSWDMRITLGHTIANAITATSTFATNLGASPTIVFGTASTWQTFSFVDFTAAGTTPAFTIPFTSPYIYIRSGGNLCWEWRMKDSTDVTTMSMDAAQGNTQIGTTLPSLGSGCTATGQSRPAVASISPQKINTFHYGLLLSLSNAPSNTGAILALGLNGSTTSIGWCGPVIAPQVLVPIQTDSTGGFGSSQSLADLAGTPPTNIFMQFGFTDPGIPGGIGVSDVAAWKSPDVPGANGLIRIYSYNQSANGSELATNGTRTQGYGLSVAWLN